MLLRQSRTRLLLRYDFFTGSSRYPWHGAIHFSSTWRTGHVTSWVDRAIRLTGDCSICSVRVQIPDQQSFSSSSLEMDDTTRPTTSEKADIKMSVGYKFGEILRCRFLELMRQSSEQDSVSIEDFINYFNRQNKIRKLDPLDTKNYDLIKYFRALDHIFQVRFVNTRDGEVPRLFIPGYSPKKHGTLSPRAGGPPTRRLLYDRGSPPSAPDRSHNQMKVPVNVRKSLNTNNLAKILKDFNKTLVVGCKISIDDYLARLDKFHPGAKGALEMRKMTIEEDPIDLITRHADRQCPVKRLAEGYLMMGDPDLYVDKYPYSSAFELSKPPPPNTKPISAEVTEIDKTPRNLFLFVTFCDDIERRNKMHAELEKHCSHQGMKVDPADLRKGLPCVVPFSGIRDFHRAVVIGPPTDKYVKVLYVDFGTVADVALASVLHLDGGFRAEPVFARPAIVTFAMSWAERLSAASKIADQMVQLTVLGYSEKHDGALVVDVDELSSFAASCRDGGVGAGRETRTYPQNDFRAG